MYNKRCKKIIKHKGEMSYSIETYFCTCFVSLVIKKKNTMIQYFIIFFLYNFYVDTIKGLKI